MEVVTAIGTIMLGTLILHLVISFSELEFDAFVAKEISRSSAPEFHRSNAATSISGRPWPVRNS
jgi:hypothetical protein